MYYNIIICIGVNMLNSILCYLVPLGRRLRHFLLKLLLYMNVLHLFVLKESLVLLQLCDCIVPHILFCKIGELHHQSVVSCCRGALK